MAAYRYLTNRMTSLHHTTDRKETEYQKMLAKAKNNKFPLLSHNKIEKTYAAQNQQQKTKNGPPLHITATKSEKSPTSLNRQISR